MNMKVVNEPCSRTERSMISELTRQKRSIRSRAKIPARPATSRKAARQNHSPSANPASSAISVAAATPPTPQPRPSTNSRSSTTFSPFCSNCRTSTLRVRSIAISQPVMA